MSSYYHVEPTVGFGHFPIFSVEDFYNEMMAEFGVKWGFPMIGEDFSQGPRHVTCRPGASSSVHQETKVSFLVHMMTFGLRLRGKHQTQWLMCRDHQRGALSPHISPGYLLRSSILGVMVEVVLKSSESLKKGNFSKSFYHLH